MLSGTDIGTALERARAVASALAANVGRVVLGKDDRIRLVVAGLLAGGHVLVEDSPGVGKTVLAKSVARSIGGSMGRIQGTADLLPTDITGVTVYDQGSGEWRFRPGPLFHNVVLVDEINRATPRAQSALLEAMAEGHATVDGADHALPSPFFVLATQNPYGDVGTFPLVEGQLDRFAVAVSLGLPGRPAEHALLSGDGGTPELERLEPVVDGPDMLAAIDAVEAVHVADAVVGYVLDLADTIRSRTGAHLGVSPRATLMLLRVAKAHAVVDGRTFVAPEDVKAVAVPALAHRLTTRAGTDGGVAVVEGALTVTPVPVGRGPPMRRRRGSRSVDLTPQALTLVLTVVLMHSVWQQSGAQIAIVIEVGVIAALVINLGWAARTAERVAVTVVGCPTDAIAGEEVGSDVVIVGTRSPIDVRLVSSPDARRYRIDPHDRGRISAVAGSRGIATAAVFEVRSAAPLGLIGAARRFVTPLPHPLYVGPRREPIPTARLPDLGIDDVPAELVRGTRPYVPGDPLRLVHWPSTARTGALAVREFEPPPAPELVVIVDLTGARRAGETAARQAAWLADEGLRRGLSVVLATCEAEGPVTAPVRAPFDVSRRLAAAVPGSPIPPTPDARRPRTFVWLTAADVTS